MLDIAINEFNLIVDNTPNTEYKQYTHIKHKTEQPQETAPEHKTDYTEFLKACIADVGQTDYFINRGLEAETIARFSLGFITAETIAQYKYACSLDEYLKNYIVIPYNKGGGYWIARSTQTEPNGGGAYKWRKPKTALIVVVSLFVGLTLIAAFAYVLIDKHRTDQKLAKQNQTLLENNETIL